MWTEIECERIFVAEPPLARQHFFQVVCGYPKGLFENAAFWQAFLNFFAHCGFGWAVRLRD
jgi:hypothetical protein